MEKKIKKFKESCEYVRSVIITPALCVGFIVFMVALFFSTLDDIAPREPSIGYATTQEELVDYLDRYAKNGEIGFPEDGKLILEDNGCSATIEIENAKATCKILDNGIAMYDYTVVKNEGKMIITAFFSTVCGCYTIYFVIYAVMEIIALCYMKATQSKFLKLKGKDCEEFDRKKCKKCKEKKCMECEECPHLYTCSECPDILEHCKEIASEKQVQKKEENEKE